MKIKPIRSLDDLREAQVTLKRLASADHNESNTDDLEILSTLVEQFEHTHFRIDAPTPVAAIRFRMAELGLSPRQLEPFIGSRARVSEVLSGKRSLSIDMIRSLHEGLDIPYESLMSARSKENEISAPVIDRLNSFGFDLEQAELLSFLQSSFPHATSVALHKRSRTQRAASKTDQTALMLWQAAVLKKAKRLPVAFAPSKLDERFLRRIAILSSRSAGPRDVVAALKNIGVSLIVLPPLQGTFLDGAAMLDAAQQPVVALTLRHDRTDNFWFTLLHELSHIHLHYDDLLHGRAAFIDDIEIQSDDIQEREADDLARTSLIPDSIISQVKWNHNSTAEDIFSTASKARVHPSIVAGRWQRDYQNYRKFARLIERDVMRLLLMPDD